MASTTSTGNQTVARYTIEICQSGEPLYPPEPSRLEETIRDAGACLEASLGKCGTRELFSASWRASTYETYSSESTDRLFLKPGSSFPYLKYLLTDYSRCITIYLVRDAHTKTLEGVLFTRGEGPEFQPQYDGSVVHYPPEFY